MNERLFYVIAGEPSGDALGARLMQALRRRSGDRVRFSGIGGPLMEAEGLVSLLPIKELAIMGMLEVLPAARRLLRRVRETVDQIEAQKPTAIITIDSSGFCFRVAERLRKRGTAPLIVHYVAPMVWAWRAHRAVSAAKAADHLLTLLPFEPPYFEAVGLPATYVGHPVVESGADRGDGAAFRVRHGLGETTPILAVLPGSRRGEVRRLLPVFHETVDRLVREIPDLRLVVPTVETVSAQVQAAVAAWPGRPILVQGTTEKYDAFTASTAALAASGTVALELAMARVPMVIGYKIWGPTAWSLRRVIKVPSVTLINLLLKRQLVPECLQQDCTPDRLAEEVGRLLRDPDARAAQRAGFDQALRAIGLGDDWPSLKAADTILRLVAERGDRLMGWRYKR